MPFCATDRGKRKAYYETFALKAKLCSNKYYHTNSVNVIGKVWEKKNGLSDKLILKETQKTVGQYRLDNPQKQLMLPSLRRNSFV